MEKLSGSAGDEALRQCYLNKVMTEFEMIKLSEKLIVQAKNLTPDRKLKQTVGLWLVYTARISTTRRVVKLTQNKSD